jgi:predicted dehydrogenase
VSRKHIRAGVVGLGFIGRAHIDALRRIPGISVAAVASTRTTIRDEADALDIPSAYTDYRDLLSDTTIDAVHNCTPNDLHYPINRATLEAGKGCFSEKPLTTTSSQAMELVTLASARRAPVAVNFNHRGFPMIQQARALIEAGDLGNVYAVHGSYLQDWLLFKTDWNWRLDPAAGGPSRAVADIGSHWMDLAEHVTGGRITEVMADLSTFVPVRLRPAAGSTTFAVRAGQDDDDDIPVGMETEDFASVLVRFDTGARGAFNVSQVSAGRKNRLTLEVDGAQGALAWDSEECERLWLGSRSDAARVALRDPKYLSAPGTSVLPAGHAEGWNDALLATIRAYYAALWGDEPAPWMASWEAGMHGVQLTEAILSSSQRRAWTSVAAQTAPPTGVAQ